MTRTFARQLATAAALLAITGSLITTAVTVSAQPVSTGGSGGFISSQDSPDIISQATGGEGDARSFAKKVLNYALGFLGFVCVVMIIYGGVIYIISAGEAEKAKKGREIILYSAIGVIIILASFAIVNTIFKVAS